MGYKVSEIFYSLQGEGREAGRAAVFVRFAGCNLACPFCDTKYARDEGRSMVLPTVEALYTAIVAKLPPLPARTFPLVVFTGGEPMLQLDLPLVTMLKMNGCSVALETNGTIEVPKKMALLIDHMTVSPKCHADELKQRCGDELKLLYPTFEPHEYETLDFDYFSLQPVDGLVVCKEGDCPCGHNAKATLEYCLAHPRWRLSLQLHKMLRIS